MSQYMYSVVLFLYWGNSLFTLPLVAFSDFTLFPDLMNFLPPPLSISSDFALFALFYSFLLVFPLHVMRNDFLAPRSAQPRSRRTRSNRSRSLALARVHPFLPNPLVFSVLALVEGGCNYGDAAGWPWQGRGCADRGARKSFRMTCNGKTSKKE